MTNASGCLRRSGGTGRTGIRCCLTYDRAALRLAEGIALELDDVRFASGKLNVRQAIDERTGDVCLWREKKLRERC